MILTVDSRDPMLAADAEGNLYRRSVHAPRWTRRPRLDGYVCRCGAEWTPYNGLEECDASRSEMGGSYALSHLWERASHSQKEPA